MHIFLTGYMGVGKTTVGRELAALLKLPFIDLDDYIEKQQNTSIPTIFDTLGEHAFRQMERESLQSICSTEKMHVISLGGGTMCYSNNHLRILASGVSVYLYKPWQEIVKNLTTLSDRPLIKQLSLSELENTFRKREPFYKLSQLEICTDSSFDCQQLANKLRILATK